jgi:hypothetical protein
MTAIIQDTIKQTNILKQDTLKQLSDSTSQKKYLKPEITQVHTTVSRDILIGKDSLAIGRGSSIDDFTFYNTKNFITQINKTVVDRFPFTFIELDRSQQKEKKTSLMNHLKDGQEIPASSFHNDWIISVILMSAFIYAVIRTFSVNVFQGLLKFVFFRGINETVLHDLDGLFYWQSTLFNLASFLNISVFGYFMALHFDLIPYGISGIYFWIFSLVVIIAGLTIRHLLCLMVGNLSGEKETFRKYIVIIYQSYRLAGLISFVLVILITFTVILPEEIYFTTGYYLILTIYFIRVLRLLFIFINRHISIFYLILYLCALEILPVVILFKYFNGLV